MADMALWESDLWLLGGGVGSCEVVHVDLRSMRQIRTPLWADRGGEVAVPSGTTVQASHVTSCDIEWRSYCCLTLHRRHTSLLSSPTPSSLPL